MSNGSRLVYHPTVADVVPGLVDDLAVRVTFLPPAERLRV